MVKDKEFNYWTKVQVQDQIFESKMQVKVKNDIVFATGQNWGQGLEARDIYWPTSDCGLDA